MTKYSAYLDPLFTKLRALGVCCHIGGIFLGLVGYADDLLLLAPSVKAAQLMLKACEEFAAERNIRFSTKPDVSKSKCKAIIMSESRIDVSKVPSLILCGEKLPFVERCDHLGHTLTSNGKMTQVGSFHRQHGKNTGVLQLCSS